MEYTRRPRSGLTLTTVFTVSVTVGAKTTHCGNATLLESTENRPTRDSADGAMYSILSVILLVVWNTRLPAIFPILFKHQIRHKRCTTYFFSDAYSEVFDPMYVCILLDA